MRMRVEIKPKLLRWACERAGLDIDKMALRIPQFQAWESCEAQPTLKQLEHFAKATHTPVGYFFLPEPPVEHVPIPDFRTVGNIHVKYPSPDLLDTVYLCQQRQEWYRDYARSEGDEPISFVGSTNLRSNIEATAERIRHALGFDLEERRQMPTWTDALRRFIDQADKLGILVMVNGVVGSNNRRKLDPEEFRGFALSDDLAPLVFINGADTKAAQMFTLAHELTHLWIGQSALSDVGPVSSPTHRVEIWCNQVAAEILVPLAVLRKEYRNKSDLHLRDELQRLARRFKVSTLVILRRINDVGVLTQKQFWKAYREELERLRAIPRGKGGDFYLTQSARVGKCFARALITSTLEGQTLHRDAFHLLGFSKFSTFRDLGHSLGIG
ncbi:MAG: ImmA/IrrE family metallo-endopeptidase [Candidatus Aureabacteria bacterium]|nr:ImmA/IrrE family metallo-endopeptidase [Candidatus Auribacterota bacterium]